jgi:hypothetical protein
LKQPIRLPDAPFKLNKSQTKITKRLNSQLCCTKQLDQTDELPIYFDELFLAKFIEEFLDENLEHMADTFAVEVDDNRKVFKDGL